MSYFSLRASVVLACAALCIATGAAGQNLVVYDDALQNTFTSGAYGGDSNYDNPAVVRSGAKAISLTGNATWNAVGFIYPGANLTAANYPVFRFWVHGGAAGGQQLRIHVAAEGVYSTPLGGIELDTYIAGGIVAGEWHEVTVNLADPPFNTVEYDRIDIQSEGVQPILYIDDVSLGQPAAQVVPPMVIDRNQVVRGMTSDRFTWRDTSNQPRVAVLAHNAGEFGPGVDGGGGVFVNKSRGGSLREFRYQLPNGITRTVGLTGYGVGDAGFGYVVSHARVGCGADDSPIGGLYAGNGFERIFEGRHHAIFRFRQNYPRICTAAGLNSPRTVPVTIDWIFSTGQDNPVWAVTWDLENANPATPVNTLDDDSRAPYGELAIDGEGFTAINGVAWGDRYKFRSTNAAGTGVTLDSPWNWETANTVPYIKEWIDGPLTVDNKKDATIGIVQTQTIAEQDAGGGRHGGAGSMTTFWGSRSDLIGNACNNPGRVHPFPCANDWSYQALANSLDYEYGNPGNPGKATVNARMTWKTQYGFLGKQNYDTFNGINATAPGWPKKSYSTYIVLGTHSSGPVEAQVAQVEALRSMTLTAAVGTVVTQGPDGIVPYLNNYTYVPAGYNHIYGALAFNAAGNQLDANIAVGVGKTLRNPLIILGNYTAGDPQTVKIGGVTLTADVDYFASPRAASSQLWITLKRNLTGADNRLEITGAAGALTAPANFLATPASTTQVDLSWTAVAGAASYQIHRGTTINNIVQIDTTANTNYSDMGRTANTTYIYKVRAVNGPTMSNFSTDAATTVVFTDDPLAVGTAIKAIHITQLRTAVAAMRVAAVLGVYGFTDPGLGVGNAIAAAHVAELRQALDQARAGIGVTAMVYPDTPLSPGNTQVKATHIVSLRNGTK